MRWYVCRLVKVDRDAALSLSADSAVELRGTDVFADGVRLGRLPCYARRLVSAGAWSVADVKALDGLHRPGVMCTICRATG